jgi:hypothetical protein
MAGRGGIIGLEIRPASRGFVVGGGLLGVVVRFSEMLHDEEQGLIVRVR